MENQDLIRRGSGGELSSAGESPFLLLLLLGFSGFSWGLTGAGTGTAPFWGFSHAGFPRGRWSCRLPFTIISGRGFPWFVSSQAPLS